MRLLPALAFVAVLATAAPASAWLDRGSGCDTANGLFGTPYAEDFGSLTAVADLDGDGAPDGACDKTWDEGASQAERAHEACHTVQQGAGHPALRAACDGPGAWHEAARNRQRALGAACADQVKAADGSPALREACLAWGDLDGDGALDAVAAACARLPDRAATQACGMATATIRARHDVAMNSIRNMKA